MTATTTDPTTHATAMLDRLLVVAERWSSGGARIGRYGSAVVLEGSVPNYAAKCKIEKAANATGLTVQNSLRVIPGGADSLLPLPNLLATTVEI